MERRDRVGLRLFSRLKRVFKSVRGNLTLRGIQNPLNHIITKGKRNLSFTLCKKHKSDPSHRPGVEDFFFLFFFPENLKSRVKS